MDTLPESSNTVLVKLSPVLPTWLASVYPVRSGANESEHQVAVTRVGDIQRHIDVDDRPPMPATISGRIGRCRKC